MNSNHNLLINTTVGTVFSVSYIAIDDILKSALLAAVGATVSFTVSLLLRYIIAALPEGPTRSDAENRKYRLEYQKFLLENRKANYGYVALLQKEADFNRIQQEIESVDEFIVAITERKVELATAA